MVDNEDILGTNNEIQENLDLLNAIAEDYSPTFEAMQKGECSAEEISVMLKENGIFRDLRILKSTAKAAGQIVKGQKTDAGKAEAYKTLRKEITSFGKDKAPLLKVFIKELLKLMELDVLSNLSFEENEPTTYKSKKLLEWSKLVDDGESQENTQHYHNILLCCERYKQTTTTCPPNENLNTLFKEIRFKDWTNEGEATYHSPQANSLISSFKFSCKNLTPFECLRVGIPTTKNKTGEEWAWFSVSRIHGDLVPLGSGYASSEKFFKHIGGETVYHALRRATLEAIHEAHKNKILEAKSSILDITAEVNSDIDGVLGDKSERKKGVRGKIRGINYEKALQVFVRNGATIDTKSGGHRKLTINNDNGTASFSIPPSGHGSRHSNAEFRTGWIMTIMRVMGINRTTFLSEYSSL